MGIFVSSHYPVESQDLLDYDFLVCFVSTSRWIITYVTMCSVFLWGLIAYTLNYGSIVLGRLEKH